MKLDLECCFLTLEVLCVIILRECYCDRELFIDVVTDQLIFEARDKGVGTDLQIVAFCLSAFKSNTVYETFVVDRYCIAIFNRSSLDRDHTAVSVLQTLQFSFNSLICRSCVAVCSLNALVLSEFNFRLNGNGNRVLDTLILTDLLDVEFRTGNNFKVMLLDCFCICRIYDEVDSVIVENSLTIVLLNEIERCFSLTETRDLKTVLILIKGLLKCCLKLFSGCFQRDNDNIVVLLFNR